MDNIYKIKNTNKIIRSNRQDIKNAKPKRLMSDIRALFEIKIPEISEITKTAEENNKMFADSLSVLTENDIVLNQAARNVKKPPSISCAMLFLLFLS